MIKKVLMMLLLALTFSLVGCSETLDESYNYGDNEMMMSVWNSQKIYNETVVLIDDGTEISGQLLFAPTRIISVRDYTLNKEYDETEYRISDNKVIRTESSTIPFLTSEQLAGKNLPEGYALGTYQAKEPGTEIVFTEGIGIIMHQISVSYEHNGTWNGEKPLNQKQYFPNTLAKLEKGEKLTVVINGDSISTGANSSGILGIQPYQDDFPTLFVNSLKRKYNSEIDLINTSLGGTISQWGKDNVDANVNAYHPDLVIIGFGMNDGSLGVNPGAYTENIEFMIKSIKARNSNAEIIVIATMVANPVSLQNAKQEEYLPGLIQLSDTYEVGLLNMTDITKYVFETKIGVDILANNINHPSDFLVRMYARGLLDIII